jgi:hypothetical protein
VRSGGAGFASGTGGGGFGRRGGRVARRFTHFAEKVAERDDMLAVV